MFLFKILLNNHMTVIALLSLNSVLMLIAEAKTPTEKIY